jgi:hypothetical protein
VVQRRWDADAGLERNVGPDAPTARRLLYLYLPEVSQKLRADQFDRFIDAVIRVSRFAAKGGELRRAAADNKYPSVTLSDLAPSRSGLDALLGAIDLLADR